MNKMDEWLECVRYLQVREDDLNVSWSDGDDLVADGFSQRLEEVLNTKK